MRRLKMREGEIANQKNNFFKNMALEEEKNNKNNKRWIQLMGSKNYYYNKNGEAI